MPPDTPALDLGHSRHRIEVEFDPGYGPSGRLICPESGCTGSATCSECHRDLRDADTKPCYACKDAANWQEECWVKGWFDNLMLDELLKGKFTVEIDAEWDGESLVAHIVEEAKVDA